MAKTMKALIVQENGSVKVQERPVPVPADNEILFQVITIGQNPTDWKHARGLTKPGTVIGCDFVGKVVELGSLVPADKVKLGETRWSLVRGGISDKGAFAQYVTAEWDLSSVVPPNITPQQAASIPIPFVTAVQALYLRLQLPQPPKKANGDWILIWSGATAVGQYAIQLAKLSGLKVATTASEKRWPLLKSLGADLVVDYKDSDVFQKLKDGTNDSIQYGLDCIAENGSIQLAQCSFRTNGGGHLITLLFDFRDLPRPDVKTESTLAYTVLGSDQSIGRYVYMTSPEDRALCAKWCEFSTTLFAKGELKPMEVEVLGGLEAVNDGFDLMQNGKHNTKLVYNVV